MLIRLIAPNDEIYGKVIEVIHDYSVKVLLVVGLLFTRMPVCHTCLPLRSLLPTSLISCPCHVPVICIPCRLICFPSFPTPPDILWSWVYRVAGVHWVYCVSFTCCAFLSSFQPSVYFFVYILGLILGLVSFHTISFPPIHCHRIISISIRKQIQLISPTLTVSNAHSDRRSTMD